MALWIAQIILGAMFLMAGFMKMFTPINELSVQINWAADLPKLTPFIGFFEVIGAFGLLLPSLLRIMPVLTPIAALGLLSIMILAIAFHFTRGEYEAIAINIVLGSIGAFVAWGRFVKFPLISKA